ncbi:MAG TPA: phytoene desaturase family protein [Propionicimonas sp.]|nr:phytoene desaturase family protein [Propionicimonas sp.]HQA77378.1 phytoene desaturase family protein [Propionicimonas sp.]HQD97150.1 phytoene desaturase family protein [Propionicimonas sp.]
MSRVIVVGAGLAGLASACRLVGDGHEVTLIERATDPGGRNGIIREGGFTFDSGPTVFTMPHLLDRAFGHLGRRLADEVRLARLDPAYRAVYADGTQLRVRAELGDQLAEIRTVVSERDAAAFTDFVKWLEELYAVEMPNFIERNFDSPLDLLTRPGAAAKLIGLGGFGRLGKAVGQRFADDRLVKLFTFQAMYAGLAPADALAIYAVITYMDSVAGVWFPEGGMHAVPAALASALGESGAELRFGTSVTSILRDSSGRVAGVVAGGEQLRADAVVVTLDLPVAYRELLSDLTPPKVLAGAQYSPSAVVWHVGVRGLPGAGVAHHNIHFGSEWTRSFEQLIRRKELMSDPSRLVTIPSLDAPDMAPDGHSALYVLEPVPHLGARIDWTRESGPMRERLHRFLGDHGYPDDVVVERLVTPADWAAQGMAMGSPFSLAHTFFQTGPFRPRNFEPRVPGVFFAGSGTTPGVGVPMVLISGELAGVRVRQYLNAASASSQRPPSSRLTSSSSRPTSSSSRPTSSSSRRRPGSQSPITTASQAER